MSINGTQSVRFEKWAIEFKTSFKQIPVPFKVYADFECNLKSVESSEGSFSKKNIKITFLAYKLVCVDDKFRKPNVAFKGENLIISEEEEQQFQSSNTCWICEKRIDGDDEKVRDHCHITAKFRGAVYWSCNINLQLTKKVPIIFHNLRGYDSHIIVSLTNLM